MNVLFVRLARVGALLALTVVMLGAWVRLTDAGLGCPDWPGCYGRLVVPDAATTSPAELGSEYTRPARGRQSVARDDPSLPREHARPDLRRACGDRLAQSPRSESTVASASRARRARDLSGPARHVDGDAVAETDRRGRPPARRFRDARVAGFARPVAHGAVPAAPRSACGGSASPPPRRSCCRFRSAVGRARTTRRSRAPISRPARRSGGPRSPISSKASCSGEGSASTTRAACSTTRRGSRCTSRTVWAPSWQPCSSRCSAGGSCGSRRRAPDGAAVLAVLLLQLSLGVSIVWFGVPLAVAVLHNGVAALLLLTVINANQRIRQR